MPKIQLSYKDNHSIDVESEGKIDKVTLSGEKTDGSKETIDITKQLPYIFNGDSLDLLRGSTVNLDIIQGGVDMNTWLLQPATNIYSREAIQLQQSQAYVSLELLTDLHSIFDFMSEESINIASDMSEYNDSNIMYTAHLKLGYSSGGTWGMSFTIPQLYLSPSPSTSTILTDEIVIHAIQIDGGKWGKYSDVRYFSDIISANTTSWKVMADAVYGFSSSTTFWSYFNLFVTYYATLLSGEPDGINWTNWISE